MILGLGNDLIDIRRIEQSLARFGDRFIERIFTEEERHRAESREMTRAAIYAKRFAAKEAAAKALGTGFSQGVYWRDLRVANLASGQPTMVFTGGAAKRLQQLLPAGMAARIDLTMTDDHPWAEAVVIISAVTSAD